MDNLFWNLLPHGGLHFSDHHVFVFGPRASRLGILMLDMSLIVGYSFHPASLQRTVALKHLCSRRYWDIFVSVGHGRIELWAMVCIQCDFRDSHGRNHFGVQLCGSGHMAYYLHLSNGTSWSWMSLPARFWSEIDARNLCVGAHTHSMGAKERILLIHASFSKIMLVLEFYIPHCIDVRSTLLPGNVQCVRPCKSPICFWSSPFRSFVVLISK